MLDFLNNDCQEAERFDSLFGLCDPQDGSRAYSDLENPDSWIATVDNGAKIALTFVAVDKCLIQDRDYPGRGRCDGILISADHLYFVELKEQARNWISDAIAQLESTIEFFKASHEIGRYKHRKAFACNRRHPLFAIIDNEVNLAFFRKHGVRLDIQAHVLVVS